ncbi:copper resistance protein CopC [Paenibacillus sp. J5C_2022]|uniref:copper resistance protein CopC n=1 Tax=Paenibacillus sp. J5C2022 TaxID=2977129 RepID=UPI0021D39561|nr:copper resistance protein CopC [Paenibacillus sp. J5C2022]MCU6709662.1 copper resistance protein CopC [Paenibacillus sp. J5C2022]
MKRIFLLIMVMLFVVPQAAMAHSKLTEAVPAVDAVIEQSPAAIELGFNTKIEKLSTFKLYNEAGEQMEVEGIAASGDKLSGNVPSPLDNGKYTVKWTIIGADGHAVEGDYSFTLDAPVAEQPSKEPTSGEATPEPSAVPSPEPTPSPDAGSNAGNADRPADGDDPVKPETDYTLFIIIGIVLIAAALVIVLRRRK